MSVDAASQPTRTQILIAAAEAEGMAVVDFDALSRRFRDELGIDVRDAASGGDHFEKWRRRRRLPAKDAMGSPAGSSRVYHRLYEDDPGGEAARPPHVDLWHWLLSAFRSQPWDETDSERTMAVPLAHGIVNVPAPATEEELATARARLERSNGPLPDRAWLQIERIQRQRTAVAARISELVDQAADWHGGALMLKMTVSR